MQVAWVGPVRDLFLGKYFRPCVFEGNSHHRRSVLLSANLTSFLQSSRRLATMTVDMGCDFKSILKNLARPILYEFDEVVVSSYCRIVSAFFAE